MIAAVVTVSLQSRLLQIYGAKMAFMPAGIGLAGVGSLLGGASQLGGFLGSVFGGQQNNSWLAQQQFAQAQNQSWDMLNAQENFQREMAQQSIHYRVDDAVRSGISPLVALGAPVYNAPPSATVPQPNVGFGPSGSGPDWSALGRAGANLGDAIAKTLTKQDKADEMLKDKLISQRLQSNDLDLQIKSANLARIQQTLRNPSAPNVNPASGGLAGQGNVVTSDDTYKMQANPSGAAKEISPGYTWQKLDEYTYQKAPSDAMLASASPWNPEYMMWAAKNRIIDHSKGPSPELLPPGTVRWRQRGMGVWEATPYWPGERR